MLSQTTLAIKKQVTPTTMYIEQGSIAMAFDILIYKLAR